MKVKVYIMAGIEETIECEYFSILDDNVLILYSDKSNTEFIQAPPKAIFRSYLGFVIIEEEKAMAPEFVLSNKFNHIYDADH